MQQQQPATKTIQQWRMAPVALLPAWTCVTSEYTFINDWQVHTMQYDAHTGHLVLVASREATLAECGKPWAETYIGHPDKPCGRLVEAVAVERYPYHNLLWVGSMTYRQFKAFAKRSKGKTMKFADTKTRRDRFETRWEG